MTNISTLTICFILQTANSERTFTKRTVKSSRFKRSCYHIWVLYQTVRRSRTGGNMPMTMSVSKKRVAYYQSMVRITEGRTAQLMNSLESVGVSFRSKKDLRRELQRLVDINVMWNTYAHKQLAILSENFR